MIIITREAAEKIKRTMEKKGVSLDSGGIGVNVPPGGCGGYLYFLTIEKSPKLYDKILESEGIRIFIDPKSLLMADESEIRWEEYDLSGKLVLWKPNAKYCNCGLSFSVE